ncbi:hypothetical protein BH09MYX1_BH09MYX1_33780 [soil metagenome]
MNRIATQGAGLFVLAFGAATLCCGGQAGLPTADDSKPALNTYCAIGTACIDQCFSTTQSRADFDTCTYACPIKDRGFGDHASMLYNCQLQPERNCLELLERSLAECFEGWVANPGNFAPTPSIPEDLVGTWASPSTTLSIDPDRHVVFESHATVRGCAVMEHLEGTASTLADGALFLEMNKPVSSASLLRDCDGKTTPRTKTVELVYVFTVTPTTAGVRLSLTPCPSGRCGSLQGWGNDYYYKVDK